LRMRKHPSKVFLVLFVHKRNSSRRGKARPRAAALKGKSFKAFRALNRISPGARTKLDARDR
ncbi:hypothetical protein, partial [uncultured Rikenella sp.]|uniref:hypothetical protein n=1 Tax=uncultured Rikenella sp. TaxID=368003 RepID=UPI00272DB15B